MRARGSVTPYPQPAGAPKGGGPSRQLGADADAAALGGAAVRTRRVPMSASVTALIETRLRAGARRRSARP